MASSSTGASSGSSSFALQNSGSSEGCPQEQNQVMDQRKRKRMISNRESARRSRMRKQKHLGDLMAQVGQLRGENAQILQSTDVTTQHYLSIEAENSILRAQVAELSHRLQSLNEIIGYVSSTSLLFESDDQAGLLGGDDGFMNPWNVVSAWMNPPAMASADIVMY
ncbi:bZIP transcription factor 44-like [Rhodamnia argentea]|uniref:BZIP transcription factor 44-like n=1 Tax=Rhodamnia argentea TaxID=178133 RepID=A0A8B8NQ57_9MYRT|nr:bZIP transcription factor 44-like [Rhodamnia argentea]